MQRNGYDETWTPARRASASFIAQSGTLEGLTGMRHRQGAELNPELTNTTRGTVRCAPTLDRWSYPSSPQLGGNARWAMGSNVVLNGTIKPDYAQPVNVRVRQLLWVTAWLSRTSSPNRSDRSWTSRATSP